MRVYFGVGQFGTIDAGDGSQHVTRFAHVYGVPLIPMGGLQRFPDGTVASAPLNLKSTAVAYGRVWGVLFAVLLTVLAYDELSNHLGAGLVLTGCAALVLFGAISLWFFVGVKTPHQRSHLALGFGIPFAVFVIVMGHGLNEGVRNVRRGFESWSKNGPPPELVALATSLGKERQQKYLKEEGERCTGGNANACTNLGYVLSETEPVKAIEAYRRACALKVDGACYSAGLLSAKTSPEAARDFFDQACQLGNADGCNNFAVRLDKKEGKRASELLDKACPEVAGCVLEPRAAVSGWQQRAGEEQEAGGRLLQAGVCAR
ncbi:MAG: sel1 repeat family protein [Archangiaceae bacterium]|nr:sel1 repeat family protein [Archangiaceae bacterium]